MDAAMTIPLLQALDAGGALIVGGWRMTGGYSTLPAVVNMAWDDKAIWTGSRHIVLIAAKNGLIERLDTGRRVSTYGITREGAALLRDYRVTRKYLRSRDGMPDSRHDSPREREASEAAPPPAARASAPPALPALARIFRTNAGVPFSNSALRDLLERKHGLRIGEGRVRGAVTELRRIGLWIEADALGFRYLGESPGIGEITTANAMMSEPKPGDPPKSEKRVCRQCSEEKWLGEFSIGRKGGQWLRRKVCKPCAMFNMKVKDYRRGEAAS